jgi:hypothetical protein
MPTRTRASYTASMNDEEETNWAAAAAAVPPAPAAMNDNDNDLRTVNTVQEEEQEEEEEWVNTGVDNDDDEEDEEPEIRYEATQNSHRPTWILKIAIRDGATNGDGDSLGSVLANVFIDSGMTAERLGRCIVQAVSATSSDYSSGYNNDAGINNDYRSTSLVGLFGKDDRVFYSLEFILAMDPADGARRLFCVTKPVRRKAARTKDAETGNYYYLSSIFPYITVRNLPVAAGVLFLAVVIAPIVVDRFDGWNQFIISLLLLIPNDLPSMWQFVSYVLDWPAREMYRYGPSIIGWEGRELIDICTQMNRQYYFGGFGRDGYNYEDRNYWNQNLEACQTIYRMKEESFARMCRPLWYLTVLVVGFFAIQRLIDKLLFKPSGPQLNRVDRAILDTYRAITMLTREHQSQEDRRRRQQQQPMAGR